MSAITIATAAAKTLEGCRLTSYQDQGGTWTIGYGATSPGIGPGVVWTQAQADARLVADLDDVLDDISSLITVTLTDNQMAALILFAFNLGGRALEESTLLRNINAGVTAPGTITADFLMWDKCRINGVLVPAAGLRNRRLAEAALYLRGVMPS